MYRVESKKDLKVFLRKELNLNNFSFFCRIFKLFELWVRGSESLPTWSLIYALRLYEYYKNKEKLTLFDCICKHYWRFKMRHLQIKHNMYIEPNVVSLGIKLTHPGFRKIPSFCEIEDNCTILPMVLLGKKKPNTKGKIIIGKNCYIATGVTILAPVRIGNNVTIGAGAVVTKNIPDNVTVVGVPAKIIKDKKI